MIRVLLVDDQELVRAGLRGILRAPFGFEVVGECADGGEVIAAVEATAPDVVLMDVRMPFIDGVQATGGSGSATGSPPVLALTTFDDDQALAGMLRAGASGFVLKGVPAEDLQRAVRTVAEGGAWLDPAVTGRVLATYRSAPAATGRPAADPRPGRAHRPRTRGAGADRPGQDQRRDRRRARSSARARSRPTSTTSSPSCGCATAPPPWCSPSTTAWSGAPAELPSGDGAAQRPAQGGEDEHGQQPPGVHAGRVHQHRGRASAATTTTATRQSSPTTKSYQNAPMDLSRLTSWSPPRTRARPRAGPPARRSSTV